MLLAKISIFVFMLCSSLAYHIDFADLPRNRERFYRSGRRFYKSKRTYESEKFLNFYDSQLNDLNPSNSMYYSGNKNLNSINPLVKTTKSSAVQATKTFSVAYTTKLSLISPTKSLLENTRKSLVNTTRASLLNTPKSTLFNTTISSLQNTTKSIIRGSVNSNFETVVKNKNNKAHISEKSKISLSQHKENLQPSLKEKLKENIDYEENNESTGFIFQKLETTNKLPLLFAKATLKDGKPKINKPSLVEGHLILKPDFRLKRLVRKRI